MVSIKFCLSLLIFGYYYNQKIKQNVLSASSFQNTIQIQLSLGFKKVQYLFEQYQKQTQTHQSNQRRCYWIVRLPLSLNLQQYQMKTHICKFDILIKKITIEIKFPCTIAAAFKIGKEETETKSTVKLEKGEARIHETLSLKTHLNFDPITNKYLEKKAILTIYVISNSGRNAAGLLHIDLGKLLNDPADNKIQKILQRCPDKNAKIQLNMIGKFMQETQFREQISANVSFYSSTVKIDRQPSIESSGNRNSGVQTLSPRPPFTSMEHIHNGHSHEGFSNNRIIRHEQFQPRNIYDSVTCLQTSRREADKSKSISQLRMQITQKDRKITRLEIQKASFRKQADILKAQITNIKNKSQAKISRQAELSFENQRLIKTVALLQTTIQGLKSHKNEFKRMESFSTKYSSEQLASRSQRLDQLEVEYRNIKVNKQEADKNLRQAKKQLRQFEEKSEDLQNSLSTLQKRLELKQNFYRDEFKKYNQRQIQLENAKIEYTNQNYALKDKVQEVERKLQIANKQKEKIHTDEKFRNAKRNEEAKNQTDFYKKEFEILSSKYKSLEASYLKLQQLYKEKNLQKTRIQNQMERTKITHKQQQINTKRKYDDLLVVKIQQLKHQNNVKQEQLQQALTIKNRDLQNLNQTLNDKSQQVKTLSQKVNDLQKKIKEKQQKIVQITQSSETLSKRLQITKKNQQKAISQINELKNNYHRVRSQNQRIIRQKLQSDSYDLKSKQHQNQLVLQLKNMIKTLSEQAQFSKSTLRIFQDEKIEYLYEIQILTQKLDKANIGMSEVVQKNSGLSDQLLRLKSQIKKSEEDSSNMKIIISQQKEVYDKQCDLLSQVKAKTSKLEEEALQLVNANSQIKRLQKTIQEKETELRSKFQIQNKLEVTVQKQQYQIQSLQQNIRSKISELQKEKLMMQNLRRELGTIKQQLELSRRNQQSRLEQINKLSIQKSRLMAEKRISDEKNQFTNLQLRKQKQLWFQRFRQLLNTMFKGSLCPSLPTLAENINLQQFLKDAYQKLHIFKQFQQKQISSQIDNIRMQYQKSREQFSQITKGKQSELILKYQVAQQDFNFYKESVRLKQFQTEQKIRNLEKNLQSCIFQLNTNILQKQQLSSKLHNSMIKIEELSAYLEQTKRQIQRNYQQKNGLISELQHQRSDKSIQLRRVSQQSSRVLQIRQINLQHQISQLKKQINQKKRTLQNLQLQNKNLIIEKQQRIQYIRSGESTNYKLQKELQSVNFEFQESLKREKQHLQKIRNIEQSSQILGQKNQQNILLIQLRQKELQDVRLNFEKEKEILQIKVNNYQIEIRNIEEKFEKLTQQNYILKQSVENTGRHSNQQFKRMDEQLGQLRKEQSIKKNQLSQIQYEYEQFKRQSEYSSRCMREQLQKYIYSISQLENKLGNLTIKIKFSEEKCSSLENQKRLWIQQMKSGKISIQDFRKLQDQNTKIKEQLLNTKNRSQLQINQLSKCKNGLLMEIQQLTTHYKQKLRETAEHYDKQIRQLTVRMISTINDADERIKRVYKEKYQDRSALEFQIQCLRQELSKYTEVRIQRNSRSKDQFIMDVSDAKMKLFLSQEPLRNIQSWIPTLINQIRQYQQTIYTHQKQIKQLQGQLESTSQIVQNQLRPGRSQRSSRRSSFFPLSLINETFRGTSGSPFIQKLNQILSNVQIALKRVQEISYQLQSVTQDKMILLTKTRQIYGGYLQGQLDYVKNQLLAMLDYSKIESGSFYVRVSKPN